jgi:hypothetical protein
MRTTNILAAIGTILLSIVALNQARAASNLARDRVHPISAHPPKSTPAGFVPNVGQWPDDAVKFVLRDRGVSAYFTDRGFVLWNGQATTVLQDGQEMKVPVAPRWSLVGAKPVAPVGGETFAHTVSYFRGNDPARWHASVPAYRDLRYPEVLDGVEMRVASRDRGFEYVFHVKPHARPELRPRYDGITRLEQTQAGDLIVRTATGHFTESRPIAFQWIHGARHEVSSSFELVSANEYRIAVGAYDERHELIVDPVLDWSTSVGGSYGDQLNTVKVDPTGDVVVAGISYSVDLPITSGFAPFGTAAGGNMGGDPQWPEHSDIYIAKFSADGTQLRWAGYLGGDGASAESIGRNKTLAVDAAGDLYITTHTRSVDFPVWPAGTSSHQGEADVSITRIKADGSAILWSRLIGGTEEDYGYAVAVDEGAVYLAGVTTSPDFPASRAFAGMQDAFVAKLSAADGSVAWASYLGGSLGERVSALAADGSGVIVLGDTDSADYHAPDFPAPTTHDRTLGGNNDAFLTKLGSSGAIVWSTFLGGSAAETTALTPIHQFPLTWGLSDMTLDDAGNIVAAGHTYSTDFPNTAGRFQPALLGSMDGYVAKLTPDGSQVLWATYLGGSGAFDRLVTVAVNPWNEILVGGSTASLDFPVTPGALKPVMQADGFQDGFLAKLDASGQQLLYSTYIGNNAWHDAVLALDYGFGRVVIGGWHHDTFFQVTEGTFRQECDNCGYETFLMSFLDAFIAHDGFESASYSGGQGDWSAAWTPSGDVSILTSAVPHSGNRHVRLRRGTGLLRRTVDLPPGVTTLRLGFWTKVDSFEGGEHANVLVSADGGNPTVEATFTTADNQNAYRYREIDLTSHLPASQVQITFDANMGDTGDNWYIDDIRLVGTSEAMPPVAHAGPDQTVTAGSSGFAAVTLNGSGSHDPDGGGIVSYEWAKGTTDLGTGVSISPTLGLGTHTITLTVTDDELDTATDEVIIQVVTAPPPQTHCVLSAAKASQSSRWRATVTVTVHNASEQLVSGATVTGTWSGGTTGNVSGTTGTGGLVSFTTPWMQKRTAGSVNFTINSVHHASLSYNPSANHNGTSIIVHKP